MNEKGFKNRVKKELGKAWHYCPNDSFQSGIPDVIICVNGRLVALELKFTEGSKLKHPLSAKQSKTLRDIGRDGGLAYLVIGHNTYDNIIVVSHQDIKPGKTDTFDESKNRSLQGFIKEIFSIK